MKKVHQIRMSALPIESATSAQIILGKRVLAKNGEQVGVVEEIFVDPNNLSIESIRVKKGLFSADYYVGSDYIDRLGSNGAILNIVPLKEFIGCTVFDVNGKPIGTVKDIKRISESNDIFSLIVSPGIGRENIVIEEACIREMGKNIMLNVSEKEL